MPAGTPAEIGHVNNSANADTAVTLSGGISVGDLVVVFIHNIGVTVSSVTDSGGNTYTRTVNNAGGGTNGLCIAWTRATSAVASGGTVTTHDGFGGVHTCVQVIKVSGLASSPLDVSSVNAVSGSGTTFTSNATATTAQADEFLVGAVTNNGNDTPGQPAGWTASPTTATDQVAGQLRGRRDYKNVSATGTQTYSGSEPSGAFYCAGIITFKVAAGATDFPLNAAPGSYALTGSAAGPLAGRAVAASPGSYALTGDTAGIPAGRAISAAPGSYALTGDAIGALADRVLGADPGSYAVAGLAALVGRELALDAQPGAYALTGAQAAALAGYVLGATPGAFDVAGDAAAVLADRLLGATPGAYALTGFDADLVYAVVGAFALAADPGSFAVSGAALSALADRLLAVDPGAFALTGASAAVVAGRVVLASPGVLAVAGADAGTLAARLLGADPGAVTLTGAAAAAVAGRVLGVDPAAFAATGAAVTFIVAEGLPSVIVQWGLAAVALYGLTLTAEPHHAIALSAAPAYALDLEAEIA